MAKKPLRLLVIGGVAAGTRAASKARRDDPSMEITIVTEERFISYAGCGLAYYIGGIVESRDSLFARSPEVFREKQNIGILLGHRAERIDTYDRSVAVTDLETGAEKVFPYDRLLIATGASAVVPPVEGIGLEGVYPLHTIPDADTIRRFIGERSVKKACILGGGYIGIEMAESLAGLGMDVTLFEAENALMPRMLDTDMSSLLAKHMESKGVALKLGTPVERFVAGESGYVGYVAAGGEQYLCGLAIVAAGVKPNVRLARDARIAIGPTGAIKVDARMETSVRGIFAAGDCAETVHLVTGQPFWLPLGSTANKMGRVAGANIAGGRKTFPGVLGTAIVKVFDLAAGRTGLTEAEAKTHRFNPVAVTVTTPARPGYYPGGGEVTLKLVADRGSGKVLGAQAVGDATVDKVIDTAAAALTGGMTVSGLTSLDLAYSPPFAPSLGALIVAGQVLEEKL
jgi:NADPH-dependent 2,4-dienoyl-CoA reductase/sulfur reductase-like enzyme